MSLKYLGNDKQNASPNVPTGKTYSAIWTNACTIALRYGYGKHIT